MRLIDADAIEYTHGYARCMDDGHLWYEACVTEDEIHDMPTIDAEPIRHGRWIFNPKDERERRLTLSRCSWCGAESLTCGNYCSYCGAKME